MAEPTAASTAELIQRATEQVSRLVRDEFQLAKIELAEKGKRAGLGVGLFGGGGVFAFYGVAVLIAAVVLGLAEVLDPWLAALVVGVVLLIIAGGLALAGRESVRGAAKGVPGDAMTRVRRDIDAVTSAVRERGRDHQ
jgi:uncharacterized membrane protein YqjE